MNVTSYKASVLAAVAELAGTGAPFSGVDIMTQLGRVGAVGTGVGSDRWSNAVRNLLTVGRKALSAASIDAMLLDAVGTVISGSRQLQRNGSNGRYTFVDIS